MTLLAVVATAHAQQPQKEEKAPTYSVQSQMVGIFLTVQEGAHRITGLDVSKFSVAEDGKVQQIDHMDSEQVPLQVALLLDTSESMTESLAETQQAATLFVQSLKPGDRVTLIPFNSSLRTIPQITNDFAPILTAIRSTRAENRTRLYDAVLYALKLLSENDKEGRKAIAVFSDGADTASTATLPAVINAASRYGYPIYAVCAGAETKNQSFQRVLRQLTEINGGKPYFTEKSRDLGAAFLEVSAELRAAYVLYYYTQLKPDDRWHELVVKVDHPGYRVYSRRGFLLARPSNSGAAAKNLEKIPGTGGLDPAAVRKSAEAALSEVASQTAAPRAVARSAEDVEVTVSTSKSKTPTFKAESRMVEVPVFVEPAGPRSLPLYAAKDFNVFEDGSRKEIAYFKGAMNMEDLPKARDLAVKAAAPASSRNGPALNASSADELILGKYYLVLDDITTDVTTFPQVKKAAEQLVQKYHNPIQPIALYLAGGVRGTPPPADIESMVAQIRKATARANRLKARSDVVSPYEAYMIDRGDRQAKDIAELRLAAQMGLKYENSYGKIDGKCASGLQCEPKDNEPVVQGTLNGQVVELVARTSTYAREALNGLRAVVAAAAADPGTYSKTVIFISPGFISGKGSRGDITPDLQNIAAVAKQHRVKILAVDIGGSATELPASDQNSAIAVMAPQLQTPVLQSHDIGWAFEKSSSLDTLALGSGSKRVKADNDIAASLSGAFAANGALYYIAYLSQQPTDGRYHRIGVTISSPSVRLRARQGYNARPDMERASAPATAASEKDVAAMITRIEQAMKDQDYAAAAISLETLRWKFQDQPDYWYNLGVAYFNLKDTAKAAQALQQAWALAPEDRATGLMLSRALAAAGNTDAAVQALMTMRARNPMDLELLIQLGRLYEAASQPAMAYEVYRSALDLSSSMPLDFYVVLIRTSVLLGRHTEAGIFITQYRNHGGTEDAIAPWTRMIEKTGK